VSAAFEKGEPMATMHEVDYEILGDDMQFVRVILDPGEAAIAEALQDGGMSEKERSLLNRLRESLDISLSDAEKLEREIQSGVRA